MVGKITEMTDGLALAATDRLEVTRDPTGTPLTRWIDGADITARVLADFAAASLTVAGKVELATIAEVNTGTDATRAVTPDSLEGSALQIKVDGIEALADVTDATNVVAAGAFLVADLASIAEVNTGTSTTKAITPDALEGSALQIKVDGIEALADVTDVANVATAADANAAYGVMSVQAASSAEATTDGTPRKIAAWTTDGLEQNMTVDKTTGNDITADVAGTFHVMARLSFSGSASKTFQVELYVNGSATGFAIDRKLGAGGDVGSVGVCGIVALSINDTVEVYHSSSDGGSVFTVTEGQMTVMRVSS